VQTSRPMTFQPRARTPRDLGRRPAKSKPRAKPEKRREASTRGLVEERTPDPKEIADKTINMLRHLGSQRFPLAPYYDHFDRWLLNLRNILSELSSAEAIKIDDQFTNETSEAVSKIEMELKELRLKETSHAEKIRRVNQSLSETRGLLAQAERENAARLKEMAHQKESAEKPVVSRIGRLRAELNQISRMRAGFFRSISKKTKAQKKVEATQRLESTRRQLEQVEQSFAAEQRKLQEAYESKRKQLGKQVERLDKELESLEAGSGLDDAVKVRQSACESLVRSVNALLERNTRPTNDNIPPA
jgi:DNA repair exonuclease SbcCD ATPase subunit